MRFCSFGTQKYLNSLYIYLKKTDFGILFFLAKGAKNTSISTPKRVNVRLNAIDALFAEKSGYLSGYLSRIYLFSCMLDKECLYLSTH